MITWPYKAGGRSRRGSHKAGTTVYRHVYSILKLYEHVPSVVLSNKVSSSFIFYPAAGKSSVGQPSPRPTTAHNISTIPEDPHMMSSDLLVRLLPSIVSIINCNVRPDDADESQIRHSCMNANHVSCSKVAYLDRNCWNVVLIHFCVGCIIFTSNYAHLFRVILK